MKKLLVYLPPELHGDLKEIAHRRKTAMAELVRQAIEQTYQDELDGLLMERELDAHAKDPASSVSLKEYLARRSSGVSG
jgi:predicted transcriptional regulator